MMKQAFVLLATFTIFPLCSAILKQSTLNEAVSRFDTKNVVCYYGSWAAYRPDSAQFTFANIDPTICTHIIYGSLGMDENGTIISNLPDVDFDEGEGLDSVKMLHKLKRTGVKVLFSVGVKGAQVSSDEFSVMVTSPEARATFINSTIKFLQDYHLDGIDIDWQFPGNMGGVPDDKINFVSLLREFKLAIRDPEFILSAQVASVDSIIDTGYDVAQLNQYLDLINVMAYDYQERRDNRTRLIAPLKFSKEEPRHRHASVDWSINKWIEAGALPSKINLGLTTYGTSYTLDDSSRHGINAPSSKLGVEGLFTMIKGLLGYNEICYLLKSTNFQPNWRTVSWQNRWTVVRDENVKAVYAYRNNQWVSYEDPDTVKEKAKYAINLKLGGLMVYGLDTDDFRGRCTGVKFPITRAIVNVLNSQIKRDVSVDH